MTGVPPTFDVRVASARTLSPSVREITFARADGAPFEFKPGQWVSLLLPLAEGEVRRAYSIASPPRGDPSFDVAVTLVETGVGSTLLHDLAPGALLRAVGPQGFFTCDEQPAPPALFIGTGTGIAPLRSMIHAGAAARTPMWLLFGGREEHDLLYRDELAALAAAHPNVRVEHTLSRGAPSWQGRRGYVQTHARELYEELAARTSARPHVYVCGLERMVGAVRALFRKDMELPRQLVHSERYD